MTRKRSSPRLSAATSRPPSSAPARHSAKAGKPIPARKEESGPQRKKRVFFTIASANYAAHAASLMQSLARHHPEAERLFVLADEVRDFSGIDLAARLLPVAELGIPGFHNMKLWYDLLEFNTAIKPFVFEALIAQGYEEVCYLDPDILVFAPLREVFDAFAQGAELVLTPHLLAPLDDGKDPSDHTILKSGVYNLGFLALRPSADVAALLAWWGKRCLTECRVDIAGNLFTDQRWMDLAPSFVARHHILRHPGYNVAYWNLAQRPLSEGKSGFRAAGEPLVFFHFSGYSPDRPDHLSRHESRFGTRLSPALRSLLDHYRSVLLANGYSRVKRYRYAYATFPDGRPIERAQRRWLLRALDEGRLDPARALPERASFFDEPDETAAAQGIALSRTAYQFWLDRPDLRAAFDLYTQRGYEAYLDWLEERAAQDGELDGRSVAAALRVAGRTPARKRLAAANAARPRTLWTSLAASAWTGPAGEARERWRGDVLLHYGRQTLRLPVQAALAWEIRSDLREIFPLTTLHSARHYLAWALTEGVVQNLVEPELFTPDFIADMARLSEAGRVWGDVPITQGLLLLLPNAAGGQQAPSTLASRQARLEAAVWYAYVAASRYRWPEAMVRPIRDWFAETVDVGCPGLPFTRLEFALWELRSDLQATFPLIEAKDFWGFLDWFILRAEIDLLHPVEALDGRLARYLLSPSPAYPRLPALYEHLAHVQHLLAAGSDPGSEAGFAIIDQWFGHFFAETYGANPFYARFVGLDFGGGFAGETQRWPVPLTAAELRPWREADTLRERFAWGDEEALWAYLEWLLTTAPALHGAPLGRLIRLMAEPSPRRPEIPLAVELLAHTRPGLRPDAPASRLLAWAREEGLLRYRGTALGEALAAASLAAPDEAERWVRPPARRVSVLLSGLWYEPTGRGEDLRGSAAALRAVGFEDFAVLDRRSGALIGPDGEEIGRSGAIAARHHVVHLNADTALEDAQFFARRGVSAGRTIGFWAWELARLPPRFRHAFSFYDEIWASTDFAAQAFLQEKLRPVRKVPLTLVLPETVPPALPPDLVLPPHAFLFLFTFDLRSYVRRKNPHAVIEAFIAAFPRGDEPVALLLKTQGGSEKPEDWQDLVDLAADPRIVLHDGPLERSAYLGLLARADAFISLHRAEGFGRGPAEAMWLEKPVILTAYSGSEDYATDETAFRIPFRLVPVEPGAYPGVEEGEGAYYWAEPYVLEAAARLRLLLARPDLARSLGQRAAMRVRTLYHPLRVGELMLRTLGLIEERSSAPARSGANRSAATRPTAAPRRRRAKAISDAT